MEEGIADIEAVSAPIPAQTGIAGGANASIAEGSLAGAGAAPAAGTVDQAAAAMAAESAQLIADAERSVAKRAVAGGLDPLAILSREVHGLSNKLQHPVDLTVQLLVLAELRGMGAKHTNTSARLGETAAQAGERLGVAGVLNAISRASSGLHR